MYLNTVHVTVPQNCSPDTFLLSWQTRARIGMAAVIQMMGAMLLKIPQQEASSALAGEQRSLRFACSNRYLKC